jgi:phosphoribosylformylglycinamidine cyclo-ligase
MPDEFSYAKSGVDIDVADAAKREMAATLATTDANVLNRVGAFASLYDAAFPGYQHPVLVLKTEEPGSKQKLALANGHVESICYDMINHLINDIAVMGAKPLSVQDAIICGKLEKDVVGRLVATMAAACRAQGCTLTGGETSEQPGVLESGTYVLTSSIVGVVEKAKIIDGSRIAPGDTVLAVASNGLHTNGYSLARALMTARPEILQRQVEGQSFLEAILRPHTCYYQAIRGLFDNPALHGLAHITGGGIQDNLNRILPAELDASIDKAAIRVLPIFKLIREMGNVPDADMLRTFNMGVGLTMVVDSAFAPAAAAHVRAAGIDCYQIGTIVPGHKKVAYAGAINW